MSYMTATLDKTTGTCRIKTVDKPVAPVPRTVEAQQRAADELLTLHLQFQTCVTSLVGAFPDDERLYESAQLAVLALGQLMDAHADACGLLYKDELTGKSVPEMMEHEDHMQLLQSQVLRRTVRRMGAFQELTSQDKDEDDGRDV